MERHTLHDAATNAAGQNQSSHSYSAWRTAQQTQPRIFQYTPPNPQQSSQQQQPQQPQQQTALNTQAAAGGPASTNLPANIDKNIIFTNNDRLTQQYNLQNAGQQSQPTFTALHDDPSSTTQAGADANLSQSSDGGNVDPSKGGNTSQTTPGGRVLASSKRAAQNRAAQRAFRQRKDRYIKSLEQKANEFDLSHSIIADLRKENIYLRDYVVRLQNEVDSLNTELGRAPMFGSPSTQRTPQPNQNQQQPLPVSLSQNYPLQIDPQTAAAAAAAAAAANVHAQDNQAGLTRLAPADSTHNAISMPSGNEQPMGEQKADENTTQTKKGGRGRKRKNDPQAEG
jgi:3',5'-cyclic AMP phosphodiesterase CpdA